jgi:DNA-binding NarL/FixJ family response regulator
MLLTPRASRVASEDRLSIRETVVLRRVVQGSSNKQIAADLAMPEAAVKATVQRLFRRPVHGRGHNSAVRLSNASVT